MQVKKSLVLTPDDIESNVLIECLGSECVLILLIFYAINALEKVFSDD